MLVPLIDVFVADFGFGMIDAMLEPHLRSIGASMADVGVVFLISGLAYCFGTLCTGQVGFYNRLP